MDLPTILAKITGVVLLIWTIFSIYKHFNTKNVKIKTNKHSEGQSISEQFLNTGLLYLWLAFMMVFSIGMIVNN
ncbi:MAG TPA: hypothetical protein VHP36_02045 [Chitinispirillaceae bacterium]|nr:hypothetical protein [Chitinispirillaceae bacterium]